MLNAIEAFPAPVSPIRPRVSPVFTSNDTPFTAYTVASSV